MNSHRSGMAPPANSLDFLDIAFRHFRNAGQRFALAIETLWLQSVKRLVWTEMARQIAEANHVASDPMHTENGGREPAA